MGWLILGLQGVAFGVLSAIVANRKGRDGFGWLLIGFFFGIFGFVAALVVADLSKPSNSEPRVGPFDPAEATKQCPRCAETIKAQASVCHYCGQTFSPDDVLAATESARVTHNAARTRQWYRDLPKEKRIQVVDSMAKEGAARGILPPFRGTFWKVSPEERNERVRLVKGLPDQQWVDLVSVAIHDV